MVNRARRPMLPRRQTSRGPKHEQTRVVRHNPTQIKSEDGALWIFWTPVDRTNLLQMYRVLSISRNVRLLLSRNDVLAMAGFSVISPKHPEEAPLLASQEDVDAVVIGHSVDCDLRRNLIAELRRICPGCLICFVYAEPDTTGEPLADLSLDLTRGPEPLVLALEERLSKRGVKAS